MRNKEKNLMVIISPEKTQCYSEEHNQSAPPGFFVKGLCNGAKDNSILIESRLQSECIPKVENWKHMRQGKEKEL